MSSSSIHYNDYRYLELTVRNWTGNDISCVVHRLLPCTSYSWGGIYASIPMHELLIVEFIQNTSRVTHACMGGRTIIIIIYIVT